MQFKPSGPTRVVDFRRPCARPRRAWWRRQPVNYVLSYDVLRDNGQVVRYVREVTDSGVEYIGRRLALFLSDVDTYPIYNVTVRRGGTLIPLHHFGCFNQEPGPVSAGTRWLTLQLLTFEPPVY